ncbi:MAG: sulfite exporter TauE/SafE family protein [Cyclobacteriaceae bacterium]
MIGAFLIGLFGSVHCVGMCGPLMISLTTKSGSKALGSFLLYHIGRIAVYAAIGVCFGLISSSIRFFEIQKYFSLALGVLLIVVFGFPKIRNRLEGWYYNSLFYQTLKGRFTKLYSSKVKWVASGLLNGFLPCGLIYLAAAGALLSHNVWSASSYMIVFGLGTIPALALLGVSRTLMPTFFKRVSNLTTPIALISGLLLIGRSVLVESPDLNALLQAQISSAIAGCGF